MGIRNNLSTHADEFNHDFSLTEFNHDFSLILNHPLQLIYLRQFRGLRCLNLAGNPLCNDEHYESFVVAHIPPLRFLDYQRVAQETKDAAVVRCVMLV